MTEKLATNYLTHVSDEVMQELLYVDLLHQVVESLMPQTTSPYFQATPHLKKAIRLLTLKRSVKLAPKATEQLLALVDALQTKARDVAASDKANVSLQLKNSAKKLLESHESSLIECAIAFGKQYYASYLERFR